MKRLSVIIYFTALFTASLAFATAQSTAFTYQGHLLQNGTPTSGSHDLSFTLWDAVSGGAQKGPTISQGGYPVANGVFTIDLDFGANVFTGAQRWLEVKVDGNALTPRQPINSVPVAQIVLSSTNGMSVTGTATSSQFTNDHLYTGVSITGQNLPMVMQVSPAFNPAGTSKQAGYSNAVDVYSLTSQASNVVTVGGGGGGGAGKAALGDVRMLVALDPAYAGIAKQMYAGLHYDNLQIDVLQASGGSIIQSFCYATVFVSTLQPMPQTGAYEMAIQAGEVGTRIAKLSSAGAVTGYVESGWNFTSNTALTTAPCVTATP
jgi:hypothetical protein